jgi:PAS domain S-box-containing protein
MVAAMTHSELEKKLSDLIAFQCVLVTLRGVAVDASEEMLWQTLLAAMWEQYGLCRVWYGRYADGWLRPVVAVPVGGSGLEELPEAMEESSPILAAADLDLPVSVNGWLEGRLLFYAGGDVPSQRAGHLSILVSEATSMLAQQRLRLRQAEALRRSEEQYRTLFEESHDLVFTHDMDGNFTSLNRAGQRICGYSLEEILKMNAYDLLTPESAELMRELLRRCGPNVSPGTHEVVIKAKDGHAVILEVSASIAHREGRPASLLGIARDISERKRAELDLLRAKEGAEAASRAKSEFLANMSHEIRTPMNGIIGMTDLTLETDLTPDQRDCLNTVRFSAGSLLSIINGILDFSKIESGNIEFDPIEFNLRESLQATIKAVAPLAEEKRLKLACEISPRIPDRLVGDPARLRQIVVNLLGNAIKFTVRGEVSLQAEDMGLSDHRDVWLHCVVADTGIGIPAAKHKTIFEAFVQADGATTRRFGGTGLGLTISARLVEMMGGRIWVESEEGSGSRFHFTVRLGRLQPVESPRPAAEPRLARVTEPTQLSELREAISGAGGARSRDNGTSLSADRSLPETPKGIRILLAEDNPVNRLVAVRLLEKQGHKVHTVANGIEAVTEVEKQDFDLVLMDVQMPEMDGVDATKAIRLREKQTRKHVSIVAVTAHAMAADREICLAAGMDGYISKPMKKQDLLSTIERLVMGKADREVAVSLGGTRAICG